MEFNISSVNLENLKEQIFVYRPNLKSSEEKENVGKKLRQQLIESKAVVKLQRIDVEYEKLITSLKHRLMLLQDVLIPEHRQQIRVRRKEKNTSQLNLLSDSSDDEVLSALASKINSEKQGKIESFQTLQADSYETIEDENVHLALRRNPGERKLCCNSYASSSTSNSSNYTKSHVQLEHTVLTSSVDCHMDENDSTPTIHIKIPSLHKGSVHHIFLDSLKFARNVLDIRVRAVKQQQTTTSETKTKKSQKKGKRKSLELCSILQSRTQQEQDDEMSQLIQDVVAEACNDETLQATNALENINNNLLDNYDSLTNDPLLLFSQSSEELKLSQNSPMIDKNASVVKKPLKYTKRSNEKNSDEPPKKRERKPKKKNVPIGEIADLPQSQPPTKSNLAKYVEHFASDCSQFIPGSSTSAASSTMSQPLVSSTTHNFEIVDQQERQQQQPVTYYIDGDWANGGPCQLVPTNGMSVDVKQVTPDDLSVPFQEIVNYIDNNSDIGNNVIARVLEKKLLTYFYTVTNSKYGSTKFHSKPSA